MTLEEARKVLGLGPHDDPESHVEQFAEARERIAELVRDAPNETIALRYQDGLLEFDKAMAAVREEIERKKEAKVSELLALVPGSVSGRKVTTKRADFHEPTAKAAEKPADAGKSPEPENSAGSADADEEPEIDLGSGENGEDGKESESATDSPDEEPEVILDAPPARRIEAPTNDQTAVASGDGDEDGDDDDEEEGGGSKLRFVAYALVFLAIGGIGGGWIYTSMEQSKRERNQVRVIFLEGLGARLVESRRWEEAREAYLEIEERKPGSELAEMGLRSIEVGMAEEQQQFVGYWSGEALAAFEAGRIDEAAEAARKVLEKYPDESETGELLEKIEAERLVRARNEWREKIRAAVAERDWEASDVALSGLREALPDDDLVSELEEEIAIGKEKERQDLAKARQLAESARLRDKGVFDPQTLEWMREAIALAPEDAEVKALYEKIASYSRTLRVPEDLKTLQEALDVARDRDRIVLGEGTFEGGAVVNVAVQLEGAGEDKTILMMNAHRGPVLTFGPAAKGATVTGLVMKHEGFDAGTSRYPVALVRGTELEFSDCVFLEGSGHGLAVVDGGHAVAQRCTFSTNGWDGAAAAGAGSRLTVRECVSSENFGHGYEVWDGAAASVKDSKAARNSRNGMLVDSASEGIEVSGCEFFGNREYGVVLNAGASGKVVGNSAYANAMGGLLVRFAAISVVVEDNRIEKNSGPGLLLEQGLRPEIYEGNQSRANGDGNVRSQIQFAE